MVVATASNVVELATDLAKHLKDKGLKVFGDEGIKPEFCLMATIEGDWPMMIKDDLQKLTTYNVEVLPKSYRSQQNGDINVSISCKEVRFTKIRKFSNTSSMEEVADEMASTFAKIVKNLSRRMKRSKMAAKILEWAISETTIKYDNCICKGKTAEAIYKVGGTTIVKVHFDSEDHILVGFAEKWIHASEDRTIKLPLNNPSLPTLLRNEIDAKMAMAKAGRFVERLFDSLGKDTSGQYGGGYRKTSSQFKKPELDVRLNAVYELMKEKGWD